MSFLKNLFKNKKEEKIEGIFPIAKGELMKIESVPDEVFASKALGDGFGMTTEDGYIYAPVSGKIDSIFPTKHAITILSDDGHEILVHMGIDTVNLNGEGFEVYVKENQRVQPGDQLAHMNVSLIEEKAKSSITMVIFTNLDNKESLEVETGCVTPKSEKCIKIVENK